MQVAIYNFKLVCTLSIVGKRVSEKRWREKVARTGGENRWREKVARKGGEKRWREKVARKGGEKRCPRKGVREKVSEKPVVFDRGQGFGGEAKEGLFIDWSDRECSLWWCRAPPGSF